MKKKATLSVLSFVCSFGILVLFFIGYVYGYVQSAMGATRIDEIIFTILMALAILSPVVSVTLGTISLAKGMPAKALSIMGIIISLLEIPFGLKILNSLLLAINMS